MLNRSEAHNVSNVSLRSDSKGALGSFGNIKICIIIITARFMT